MSLAQKPQLPAGQKVRVLNAPRGIHLDLDEDAKGEAVIVFVKGSGELKRKAQAAFEAARDDRLAWIAYPKVGQLDTDLSRDKVWAFVEGEKMRPVRQVALDGTWSALRFRPA